MKQPTATQLKFRTIFMVMTHGTRKMLNLTYKPNKYEHTTRIDSGINIIKIHKKVTNQRQMRSAFIIKMRKQKLPNIPYNYD